MITRTTLAATNPTLCFCATLVISPQNQRLRNLLTMQERLWQRMINIMTPRMQQRTIIMAVQPVTSMTDMVPMLDMTKLAMIISKVTTTSSKDMINMAMTTMAIMTMLSPRLAGDMQPRRSVVDMLSHRSADIVKVVEDTHSRTSEEVTRIMVIKHNVKSKIGYLTSNKKKKRKNREGSIMKIMARCETLSTRPFADKQVALILRAYRHFFSSIAIDLPVI